MWSSGKTANALSGQPSAPNSASKECNVSKRLIESLSRFDSRQWQFPLPTAPALYSAGLERQSLKRPPAPVQAVRSQRNAMSAPVMVLRPIDELCEALGLDMIPSSRPVAQRRAI